MARPASFNDYEINKFAGLDLRGPAELQPEKTLAKCINMEVGLLGELKKRPGIQRKHTGGTLSAANGVKLLGDISNQIEHQILAQTDLTAGAGRVWKSEDSGVTWTQISSPAATNYNCGKCIQYAGNLTIPSLSGIQAWTGTAWTSYPTTPKSNKRCVVLQNRIFLLEDATNYILFSEPGDASTWPATNKIGSPVEDRDLPCGIIAYRDRLVILRQNSLDVLYTSGPPSSWNMKRLPFGVGVPNENCAVVYNDLLYLLSYDGVYRTDLTQMEEISKPLAPIFGKRRKLVFSVSGIATKYIDCMAYYNGRMVCSIYTDTLQFRMMVFNIDNNTWTEWLPIFINNTDGYPYNPPRDMFSMHIGKRIIGGAPFYQAEGIYMSFSSTDGMIYFFDDQNPSWQDTPGFSYPITVRTKSTNAELPAQHKRAARMSIRARKSSGSNLTALYNINGVDGSTFNIPIDTTLKQTRFRGPGYFREVAIEVTDTSNTYLEIEDFVISIKRKSDVSESLT